MLRTVEATQNYLTNGQKLMMKIYKKQQVRYMDTAIV